MTEEKCRRIKFTMTYELFMNEEGFLDRHVPHVTLEDALPGSFKTTLTPTERLWFWKDVAAWAQAVVRAVSEKVEQDDPNAGLLAELHPDLYPDSETP